MTVSWEGEATGMGDMLPQDWKRVMDDIDRRNARYRKIGKYCLIGCVIFIVAGNVWVNWSWR